MMVLDKFVYVYMDFVLVEFFLSYIDLLFLMLFG